MLRCVASSLHQARGCCGSIQAWNTRSGSDVDFDDDGVGRAYGVVHVSEYFLFVDEAFEIAELVLPHVTIVREPVVDVLQRPGVELVQSVAPDQVS